MAMIDVDVWVRGSAGAVTHKMKGVPADADNWTDADVKTLLEQMLKALDRARDPAGDPPAVALRGFSWIVSPDPGGVLVHIEMQLGTASAGPFAIAEARLSDMITRVIGGPRESKLVH
ncbi:MAG: hypothetical protein WC815_10945 [Vicinamibacterales bacterium]